MWDLEGQGTGAAGSGGRWCQDSQLSGEEFGKELNSGGFGACQDPLLLQKECTEAQEEQGHSLGCYTPMSPFCAEIPHISREHLVKAPEGTWLGCAGAL